MPPGTLLQLKGARYMKLCTDRILTRPLCVNGVRVKVRKCIVYICAEAGIELVTRTAPIRLAIYGPTVNRLSYPCIPKNECTENIVIN